jgi:hypothetical protein
MYGKTMMTIAAAAALSACTHRAKVEAGGDVAPVKPSTPRMLPVGTTMDARFDQDITTSSNIGDRFSVTVAENVMAANGQVAVPRGTRLYGKITGVHKGGVNDRSVIRLDLNEMDLRGNRYPFSGSLSNVTVKQNRNAVARDVAIGAGAGAVLGTVLSGAEVSSMVAGGLLGAAAGTAYSLGKGDAGRAKIPAGSDVTVRATQAVHVR